ncbi:MAG: hypothetical protein INR64_13095, partial [Caulobacteraceae bacterium]|nr:hypothetical protein [Caulobacter sp.]
PQGASQTCTIAAAPLGGAYRARDLTYTFEDGRLTRIAFDASIDALPYAAAVVKRQFGAPATTRRDSIQTPDGPLEHLAYTWAGHGASARLSDPTRASDRLQVVLSLGGA